jgi:tryptophan synthase alpha chain
VLLAAPVTPDERLQQICDRSHGFVYAVSLMGVTGERSALAASASVLAKRAKALTDKPVLLGVGVSTPAQAIEAAVDADGVIVGAAVMRRVLAGEGAAGVAAFVCDLRTALDT